MAISRAAGRGAPEPGWTHWDAPAEQVHRVPRDILEPHGKPAAQVAESLNELLGNGTVYSDGWVVDQPSLIRLFSHTRVPQQFSISPLELILSEEQMAVWHAVKAQVIAELALTRHRASFDAMIIQETYCRTRQVVPARLIRSGCWRPSLPRPIWRFRL